MNAVTNYPGTRFVRLGERGFGRLLARWIRPATASHPLFMGHDAAPGVGTSVIDRATAPVRFGLTLEHGTYLMILLFAALWRWFDLAVLPLSLDEARQALTAWQAAQGQPASLAGLSPLLFTLQEATFWLATGSDVLARLWPALAGVAICLLPFALRRSLGRGAALLAAGFLALSPTITYFARYASGDVLAATWALAALTAWLAAREDARWRPWVGVALALGVLSGPGLWTALLAWVIVWAWERRGSRSDGSAAGEGTTSSVWSWPAWRPGGLVFLVAATAGLRHWDGIGAAASLLGTWAMRWAPSEIAYPFYWPWVRLLLDEPLLLAWGLYGAWRGWRRGDRLARGLTIWAGIAMLWATLTPGRQPQDLVIAIPPLALLAGVGARAWIARLDWSTVRAEMGALGGALGVMTVTLYVWASGYTEHGTAQYGLAMLAPAGLMVGLVLFFRTWVGWQPTLQTMAFFFSALGLLWTASAGWINARGIDFERRPAVQFETTSSEARLLAEQVARLSAQRVGDAHSLSTAIVDSAQAPILQWYLRAMMDVRVVGAPGPGVTAPVVIAPSTMEVALAGAYSGRAVVIVERWSPLGLRGRELARWVLLRQGVTPAQSLQVIMWVAPADIVRG